MVDAMKEQIWKTKEGIGIPVGDMTESHAKNALRMMIFAARKRGVAMSQEPNCEAEDAYVSGVENT